jgi:hypothetical protein
MRAFMQFTLRAFLICIICLCVCLGFVRIGLESKGPRMMLLSILLSGTSFGMAIGVLANRPFIGGAIGMATTAIPVYWLWLILI